MRHDPVFQSILPEIEKTVSKWVEDAVSSGFSYIHYYAKNGVLLFKSNEGKTLQRKLHFQAAFHKAGRLRPPFPEMTEYALQCALKDPRMKEWVTPARWNSVGRQKPESTTQEV